VFCPQCRDEFREGFTRCRGCDVDLVAVLPPEGPAPQEEAAAPATPEPAGEPAGPRAARVFEMALVYFIGFGSSLVSSLHHFSRHFAETDDPASAVDLWHHLGTVASRLPPIAVLAFVLTRRGRTLRDIGLTFRWTDLPLAALVLAASWPAPVAVAVRTVLGLKVSAYGAAAYGFHGLRLEVLAPLSLLAILASAAAEELIVRAYLMTEVIDLTGSALLAVGLSVFLQDVYHLYQGVFAVIQHAMPFLVYSLFYWKTRRATPIVLAHFAHNLWLDLH
jgi:membrane protease YdiL (CAAX protease family)